MIEKKINKNVGKQKVLLAPLDWGLGHATRCIPIIKHLLSRDCQVIIAAAGGGLELLKKEFAECEFLDAVPYNIYYGKTGKAWHALLRQLPKFYRSILQEKTWLKEQLVRLQPDLIISDNRFGLYSDKIPCIYITHQLQIRSGIKWLNKLASTIHHHFIRKYSCCWIPDTAENTLAGELSKNNGRLTTYYLGPVSRLGPAEKSECRFQIVAIISGPEPQREIFEKLILTELVKCSLQACVVRGLPDAREPFKELSPNVVSFNHLPAKKLSEIIDASDLVICRSGYTSIMDLVKKKKKAILVPTPGQPEQEYLADNLSNNGIFLSCNQETFKLTDMLEKLSNFPFAFPDIDMQTYKTEIDKSLTDLGLYQS